jgi:hypothetical protein
MELEVACTFIRKIITIQGCRCIMRDMSMFRYGDMIFRNVVDCDKSLFPLVSRTFHWGVELLIEMELEVAYTFIRKIMTRRQ